MQRTERFYHYVKNLQPIRPLGASPLFLGMGFSCQYVEILHYLEIPRVPKASAQT